MKRLLCLMLLAEVSFAAFLQAQNAPAKENVHPHFEYGSPDVWSDPVDGLFPNIIFSRHKGDWHIEIDYFTRTNYPSHTWLLPTNRTDAKVELWETNGASILPTNPSVIAATNPPPQTTVSEILNHFHPSNMRGMLWLRTVPGYSSAAANFDLGWAYGIRFTNDYVLRITPFIYKPGTNLVGARLIEFKPIKVKLLSNGSVEQLDPKPWNN